MRHRNSIKPGLQTSNNLYASPGHLTLFNMNLCTAQVESKYFDLHQSQTFTFSQHRLPQLYYYLLLSLTNIRRHMLTQDLFLTFKTVSHFSAKINVNLVLLLISVNILWCNKIYILLNNRYGCPNDSQHHGGCKVHWGTTGLAIHCQDWIL